MYLETVRTHPLYNIIQDELNQAFNNVTRPNLDNYKVVLPSETFVLFSQSPNPIRVAFDQNFGSISNLSRSDTIYWTSQNSQLASYIYVTYNQTDFTELSHTYMTAGIIYLLNFPLDYLFFLRLWKTQFYAQCSTRVSCLVSNIKTIISISNK